MLEALGRCLSRIQGVSLLTLRDARMPVPGFDTEVLKVGQGEDLSLMLAGVLDNADAFWPIAPETDGALAALCRIAEAKGCLLLNSPSSMVDQTGSKLATYHRLSEYAVPCIETWPCGVHHFPRPFDTVVKPDDGAGCEHTFLISKDQPPPYEIPINGVCQPLVEGTVASASVVYPSTQSEACVLAVNRQRLAIKDAHFSLLACEVNALPELKRQAQVIAYQVRCAFPDLTGYVGIDFIVTDGGLIVLEINPRLTTSFVGLQQLQTFNPCALVLDAVCGRDFRCPDGHQMIEVALGA